MYIELDLLLFFKFYLPITKEPFNLYEKNYHNLPANNN